MRTLVGFRRVGHGAVRMAARSPQPTPNQPLPADTANGRGSGLLILLIALVVLVGFLFRDSFKAEMATFSNDGPLGIVNAAFTRFPAAWLAVWADLNWLGMSGGSTPFDLTSLLAWLLGPLGFIKFYPGIAIVTLGLCAWVFFRQLGFHPGVCIIGGLAAALNSDFFSYACWGLGTLTLCVASVFLALAALTSKRGPAWARPVLAGAALGLALMEGFDNGAIFSLYVAAFAVYQAWNREPSETAPPMAPGRRLFFGAASTAIVAVVSAVVAGHVLISLIQINITGTVGMGQDKESRANRWAEVTQYGSLPPAETLRAIIPGLYGYRLDTPNGGRYWGRVGSDPDWDAWFDSRERDPAKAPRATLRHSGAGHYTGVAVVLLAVFAVAQSLRKTGNALTPVERRWVWFWALLVVPSLFFSFGRFSPAYRLVYALPYFNSIRLPMKFLHPMNLSLVILCGYGAQALWRGWMQKFTFRNVSALQALKTVFSRKGTWEQRWATFSFIAVAIAWLGWLVYGSNRSSLAHQLQMVGFDGTESLQVAKHSIGEVAYFAFLLTISAGWIATILGGAWSGEKSRLGLLALGFIVSVDLARSNIPWVQHYNWKERYTRDPLTDVLSAKPHEGRVSGQLPFSLPGQAGSLLQSLGSVYSGEWNQHQFRYYNIQSLEVVQLSRPPAEYVAYLDAMRGNVLRQWELGNVRWLLALAPLVEPMNQQLDPARKPFRTRFPFNLSQTQDGLIRVETNNAGPFALVEFTGALPRAMLFDQWRSGVSDDDALKLLPSTNFNPHAEVLVADSIPAPSVTTSSQPAGSVTFASYAPTRVVLDTEARTPCVLLLNDKHDKDWKVYVDGKEDTVLRANYVVRGVYLSAGKHRVEFRFQPPLGAFWVSLASLAASFGVLGLVIVKGRSGTSGTD